MIDWTHLQFGSEHYLRLKNWTSCHGLSLLQSRAGVWFLRLTVLTASVSTLSILAILVLWTNDLDASKSNWQNSEAAIAGIQLVTDVECLLLDVELALDCTDV